MKTCGNIFCCILRCTFQDLKFKKIFDSVRDSLTGMSFYIVKGISPCPRTLTNSQSDPVHIPARERLSTYLESRPRVHMAWRHYANAKTLQRIWENRPLRCPPATDAGEDISFALDMRTNIWYYICIVSRLLDKAKLKSFKVSFVSV